MGLSILRVFRGDHWIIRQLASVKLTVILLVAIGLACIVGTLVPQADMTGLPPDRLYRFYADRYGPALHRLFNALSIYRLYSSWWFSTLLALLAVNMMVCSLKRLRRRWRQLGFQLTHLSIVFLLVGVLAGLNRREGMMQIFEGEQSSVLYLGERPRVPDSLDEARRIAAATRNDSHSTTAALGFAIRLDDFEIERHTEPLDRIRFQAARVVIDRRSFSTGPMTRVVHSPVRSFNIAHQKRFARPLGEPWDIEVVETMPVYRPVSHVVEAEDQSLGPAVEIELASGGRSRSGWLFSRGSKRRLRLLSDTEIEYDACATRAELDRLLAQRDLPTTISPDLLLVTVGKEEPTTLPFRLGVEQAPAGSTLTATILRFFPDFRIDRRRHAFSASNERHNPAVEVRVRLGDAARTQWVFSRLPQFSPPLEFDGTTVTLRFLEGRFRRRHVLRVLDCSETGDRRLQLYTDGRRTRTIPAAVGTRVPLSGGVEMRLTQWLDHATTRVEQETDPDRVAARLRIRNRRTGRVEEIKIESGQVIERGRLSFAIDRDYPIKQFISRVRVIKDGREVLRKTIQMNDPLKYGGYEFYQSSYDSKAGDASRYTILSVNRDPGVGFVYIGFGMLTAGLIIVFYVNPFLKKRSGEQKA